MSHPAHLVRRFFGSLRARHPGPVDQRLAADLLSAAEARLFWAQPTADLSHALRAAHSVLEASPNRPDLARAALLHDVGKRHCGLGTFRRSLATAVAWLHVRPTRRMRAYLDHAALGAAELEAIDAPDIVVAFARHHHETPPDHVDPDDWALLVAADAE